MIKTAGRQGYRRTDRQTADATEREKNRRTGRFTDRRCESNALSKSKKSNKKPVRYIKDLQNGRCLHVFREAAKKSFF